MPDYYQRRTCRMCEAEDLQQVMTLSPTPPGNSFLRADQLVQAETRYPLELHFCRRCTHLQLGHVVDPRILYQNSYGYVSGTSPKFVEHLQSYASDVVSRFTLKQGSLVADIGSNDGTCLRCFQAEGMQVLGIDPATEIGKRADASGIPTICDFFSEDLGARLRERYGPAAFITSHNTCAHIDRLDGVLRGVERWLADDGVFGCEVGYFLDVHQNGWFDTIYHEHLDYHTVRPFERLLARVGLQAISAHRVSPQGGSIRLFAGKAGRVHTDESIAELMRLESDRGLDRPETLARFERKIAKIGEELRTLIAELKRAGKWIAAFGAPTKSTTLLTHFGLGRSELDFIVDDNPLKHGLFSPLTHIPVFAPDELYRRRPDYALILAWNFAQPIMAAHRRFVTEGGRFMVPMPVPAILEG